MMADMETKETLNPVVIVFFFKMKKTQHFTCFLSKSSFKVSKAIRQNATHYFIMKMSEKRELQLFASITLLALSLEIS